MAYDDKENKSNKTALFISLTLHAGMLLLFFFLMAWRAPDPPLPEYGIELNFGTDDVGSGNVQTTSQANNAPKVEDARPNPPAAQPTPPASEPEPEPEVENEPAPDLVAEDVEEIKTVETESPVAVEKKEPEKKVETPPVKEPVKEKEPEKKPEPKPVVTGEKAPSKPVVNNDALMTNKTDGAGGKDGNSDKVSGNNNGDDKGKVGDKGNPEGTLDAKALYGTPGGGGGGDSYNIRGWSPDFKPKVNDDTNESGRIVFQVKIDDEGRIISVIPIEKTVSPAVVAVYKREVEKLTFSPTSENTVPAPTSTGTITFILRSN